MARVTPKKHDSSIYYDESKWTYRHGVGTPTVIVEDSPNLATVTPEDAYKNAIATKPYNYGAADGIEALGTPPLDYKLTDKEFRIKHCGRFAQELDPLTGDIKSFPYKCHYYRDCPKCREERIEETKFSLRDFNRYGVYYLEVPADDSNSISRKVKADNYLRYPREDGSVIFLVHWEYVEWLKDRDYEPVPFSGSKHLDAIVEADLASSKRLRKSGKLGAKVEEWAKVDGQLFKDRARKQQEAVEEAKKKEEERKAKKLTEQAIAEGGRATPEDLLKDPSLFTKTPDPWFVHVRPWLWENPNRYEHKVPVPYKSPLEVVEEAKFLTVDRLPFTEIDTPDQLQLAIYTFETAIMEIASRAKMSFRFLEETLKEVNPNHVDWKWLKYPDKFTPYLE